MLDDALIRLLGSVATRGLGVHIVFTSNSVLSGLHTPQDFGHWDRTVEPNFSLWQSSVLRGHSSSYSTVSLHTVFGFKTLAASLFRPAWMEWFVALDAFVLSCAVMCPPVGLSSAAGVPVTSDTQRKRD